MQTRFPRYRVAAEAKRGTCGNKGHKPVHQEDKPSSPGTTSISPRRQPYSSDSEPCRLFPPKHSRRWGFLRTSSTLDNRRSTHHHQRMPICFAQQTLITPASLLPNGPGPRQSLAGPDAVSRRHHAIRITGSKRLFAAAHRRQCSPTTQWSEQSHVAKWSAVKSLDCFDEVVAEQRYAPADS